MAVSKFKATCLAVMEEVRQTREPVLVTRRGQAMVEINPPNAAERPDSWMGQWRGQFRILGDIVSPACDPEEWEAISNPDRVLDPSLPPLPKARGKRVGR